MGVRYAKFEDIKNIVRVQIDGWKTAYKGIVAEDYLNSLNYEVRQKKVEDNWKEETYVVYESDDNEILGFSGFGERQNLELEGYDEYDCELGAIYVRPDCKGKGIGKEIFNFVSSELWNKGKTKMILWVLEDNLPSIEFYKKMGGKIVSKKEQKIGNEILSEISFGYDLSMIYESGKKL